MNHIKEYDLFEVESPRGKVSVELQSRFPKIVSDIKNKFKYFFSRGLFGYFDVEDKNYGTILKYVPQDESIPAIEFNAFVIPELGDHKKFNISDLIFSKNPKWKEEDIASINNFSKAIGRNTWSGDFNKWVSSIEGSLSMPSDFRWFSIFSPQGKYFEGYLQMLLPYTKYTTPGNIEEVTLDQIKSTDAYKRLLQIGAIDDTSDRVWSNGNLRIKHPMFYYTGYKQPPSGLPVEKTVLSDTMTIYAKGPIRITSAGRPFIINSAPGFQITNLDGWERKIDWVTKYLMKRLTKDEFDVGSTKKQEVLADLPIGEYFESLLDIDDERFIDWLLSQSDEFRTLILDSGLNFKGYIEKDPAKAAVRLKKIYKHPSVKKAIDSLDQEATKDFADNITLTGNLGEIGF
jgi:hypothetical protein